MGNREEAAGEKIREAKRLEESATQLETEAAELEEEAIRLDEAGQNIPALRNINVAGSRRSMAGSRRKQADGLRDDARYLRSKSRFLETRRSSVSVYFAGAEGKAKVRARTDWCKSKLQLSCGGAKSKGRARQSTEHRVPPELRIAKKGEEALQRLQKLCEAEGLDRDRFGKEAFDGGALLLLSAEKLAAWDTVRCHGKRDCAAIMRRIVEAARPLRVPGAASAESSPTPPTSQYAAEDGATRQGLCSEAAPSSAAAARSIAAATRSEVLTDLHWVEREWEHVQLARKILRWEDVKLRGVPQAHIHISGYTKGQGITTAGWRAANPHGGDLDNLVAFIKGEKAVEAQLPRLLACLRVPIIVAFGGLEELDHSTGSREEALASLFWEAFRNVAEILGLDVSIARGEYFAEPMEVLQEIRLRLSERVEVLLHFDAIQTIAKHAAPGGWYSHELEDMREIVPLKKDESSETRDQALMQMAGTYGLWRDFAPVIQKAGVCALITGRTMAPYLMGKNYSNQAGKFCPGEVHVLHLPPLSPVGILETIKQTRCHPSQLPVVEALGFTMVKRHEQDQVREVEECPDLLRAPKPGHGFHDEDSCPEERGRGMKRKAANSAGPCPSLSEGQPCPQRQREACDATLTDQSHLEHDAEAVEVSAVQTTLPKLSKEAQRLQTFVLKLHWVSSGVPLLVRKALEVAVAVKDLPIGRWSQVGPEDIAGCFEHPSHAVSFAVYNNGSGLCRQIMWELSTLERHQLLVEALLRRVTHVRKHDQLSATVIKGLIYAEVAQDKRGRLYVDPSDGIMPGILPVIPLLPPPIVANSEEWFNPAAALLPRALAETPGLLRGGAPLETVTRFAVAARIGSLAAIQRATGGSSLAATLPFLRSWAPAEATTIVKRNMFVPIPGVMVEGKSSRTAGSTKPAAADDWRRMPWAKLLPESEAHVQLRALGDAVMGLPHPCSAGPDIIVQAGGGEAKDSTARVVCGIQCKLRTDTAEITPNMVLDEVTCLDRLAQSWATHRPYNVVVLIYLAVGPRIHNDVKRVGGQVLPPGSSVWKRTLPPNVHLIIPDEEQVAQLLGKEAFDSFSSFGDPSKGVSASDVEALASALAAQAESSS